MISEKTIFSSMTIDSYWRAIHILINKPHVINKRLWGQKNILEFEYNGLMPTNLTLGSEKLNSIKDNLDQSTIMLSLLDMGLINTDYNCKCLLMELLPKCFNEKHAFQLIFLSLKQLTLIIYDVSVDSQRLTPNFPYLLQHNNGEISMKALCDQDSKSLQWLFGSVLPQIIKWGEEVMIDGQTNLQSLALVSGDGYYTKYNQLKEKYGKEMVKIWPECTDPSKFVYEDIAIATYLILLWEEERKKSKSTVLQSFVDLGCGNGLLVYILAMEGYKGYGVDVRRRQIWDLYPDVVILEERTITPSDLSLFPNIDWIIGNHSDELTPWIPVVAARSSFKCNFFLLPCCAYNFDGTKYQRQNSSKSQYSEYLEYVKDLSEKCGFITATDRLKIPSTKRICIVGCGRNYPQDNHQSNCDNIQNLFSTETHSNSPIKLNNQQNWIENFKPRDLVEKVRNCTKIEKSLVQSIVDIVTKHLLKDSISNIVWSLGKCVDISEIVSIIPQDMLKSLKSECGGLQTLMKNNHHIFKVQGGKVQLRHPRSVQDVQAEMKVSKNKNVKIHQRPCWFYNNHPQGCPLLDNNCSFLHTSK